MPTDGFPTELADISPATAAVAVTPDDNTDLAVLPRAIYIGGAGDLVVVMEDGGAAVKFANVQAGTVLAIRAARVKSTNTTATLIVALW